MFEINSTIAQYCIKSVIGRGGTGTVYLAFDTILEREVALKIINDDLSNSQIFCKILSTEAKKAARIDSPFVVKVWEYSEENVPPFISLELVKGQNLRDVSSLLNFSEKIELIYKISEGIMAAHNQSVIHKDLKPENIIITSKGSPKILDFGLAVGNEVEAVDTQGDFEGTIDYASPEQIMAEPLSPASDQFSFGIILYELITGQRPFESKNQADIVYSILYEEPIPPNEINHEISDWLNSIIMRLLRKKPEERFRSFSEITDLFERKVKGEKIGHKLIPTKINKTVSILKLKNRSDDTSWDYFCDGFTEDLINELKYRTDFIISPTTISESENIDQLFESTRSHFIISGSLSKWIDKISLALDIYSESSTNIISRKKYEGALNNLFDLLAQATNEISDLFSNLSGTQSIKIDSILEHNVTAYDYYLKGKNYYQTNRPEDLNFAENMFKKALEIDPNMALAHSGLSDVYAFQYMAYYIRTPEKIDQARDEATIAIAISPQLPEALRSLGRYYMFSGNMEQAENSFIKAVELNPKYAIGFRSIGWMKYINNEYNDAVNWAVKSLQLLPTDVETMLLIGKSQTFERKYKAAKVTLQRALEISPDYGRAYYDLGIVYTKLGAFDLALKNLNLASKYKGDPNSYVDAAYIYLIKKEYDKATILFNRSINEGFFPFISYYFLGVIQRVCTSKESSQKLFKKVFDALGEIDFTDSENIQAYTYYAMAQAACGQSKACIVSLSDILKHEITIGEIWLNIARCYALMENLDKTNEYLKLALTTKRGPTIKEIEFDPHFKSISNFNKIIES